MLQIISVAAMTFAAITTSPVPATASAAQAAPVTAPQVALSRPGRRRQPQTAAVALAGQPSSDAVPMGQNEIRLLLPPLSGDGGG